MRVVAIHAGHGAFGQAVLVRPLELGPNRRMAACAQLVDRRHFSGDEPVGAVAVDGVAGGTTHLVLGMAALDAADVGGLIQMALQAVAIGLSGRQVGRVNDIRFVGRCGVLPARTVAGLAGLGSQPRRFWVSTSLCGLFWKARRYLRGKAGRFPSQRKPERRPARRPEQALARRGWWSEPPPASKAD
jgi:hypothetical protein